jgi:GT2 family glycosyltransferase
MLIDREVWDRLGGFDGRFFMYGEEADFCLRAAKIGARPAFTPVAAIIHYGGASEQVHADKIVRSLGARAELIKRYVSPGKLGLFVNTLLPLVRALAYGMAAGLFRDPRLRAQAEAWRSVWARRTTWQFGLDGESGARP